MARKRGAKWGKITTIPTKRTNSERRWSKEYMTSGYANFGEYIVTDESVWKYVRKHMHFWDLFDYRKVVVAALSSFGILADGPNSERVKQNQGKWYYGKD